MRNLHLFIVFGRLFAACLFVFGRNIDLGRLWGLFNLRKAFGGGECFVLYRLLLEYLCLGLLLLWFEVGGLGDARDLDRLVGLIDEVVPIILVEQLPIVQWKGELFGEVVGLIKHI